MSVAMCLTGAVMAVEVGLTIYNLNKAGAFDKIKDKFKHKVDIVKQPTPRSLQWKRYSYQ